ncbi:SDR family oxidoreductase [Pseudomonas sp. C27(2019)]|uniref:UDP-glucose 4-epimerase family protein n=1 Tax=Pseudomonas sp. C27(2019) TaxID=2604941 RepID=UPI001243DCD6|nr:SDR family oxidoreductase [Pseudomonas sp. C27(2019)]QEY60438.1 SDR family oxidoreductase [Pseudomonas sp. C27(2019)]
MNANRLLLTGSTGFVGGAIQQRILVDEQYDLTIAVRREVGAPSTVHAVQVADLTAQTDWTDALQGIDVVIHSAARVHVMNETSADPLAEFRKVNVEGTLALARQAVAAGVKRFVFVSSIKVNGEGTTLGQPYTADAAVNPSDPYGVSKYEAEQALLALAQETGLEVAIVRPVLVYGPGVKANFRSMMKWVQRGVPLPLGSIHNKRSLVALDNLVDLILTCVEHPGAINQVFLASDGNDLSTTQMLQQLGVALGKPARLLPVPMSWLNLAFSLLGKRDFTQRLCGSLQVDIAKNEQLLGWTPPVSVEEAMGKTAAAYLAET